MTQTQEITQVLTPEIMPEVAIDREHLFISNLATHPTQYEAAIAAGYSPTYARTSISLKFKSDKFLDKLKAHYNGNAAMLLPRILNAESKAVGIVNDDPTQLPKYHRTLSELKRSAGVLQPDPANVQQTIQVTNIRNLFAQAQDQGATDQEVKERVRIALEKKAGES